MASALPKLRWGTVYGMREMVEATLVKWLQLTTGEKFVHVVEGIVAVTELAWTGRAMGFSPPAVLERPA